MAHLEPGPFGAEFLDRIVSEFMESPADDVRDALSELTGFEASDIRQLQIRATLLSFGSRLLAAAARGGGLYCNDGSSRVPCDFILRPGDTPYYRCAGHATAHCYHADYTDLSPCP